MRQTAVVICTLGLLSFVGATTQGESNVPTWGDEIELLILDARGTARIVLRTEIDGIRAGAIWDKSLQALFGLIDQNKDQVLSATEAPRLPTPFELRRSLWGNFDLPAGMGDGWKSLDVDHNGHLQHKEVVDYYAKHGVGVQVGVARVLASDQLHMALIKHLDRDHDAQVSLDELRASEENLASLDRNEDELISPSELVRGLLDYPGVLGATRLEPATTGASLAGLHGAAVWLLPPSRAESGWSSAFLNAFGESSRLSVERSPLSKSLFDSLDTDRDGFLTAPELTRWRTQAATTWTANWDHDTVRLSCSHLDVPECSKTPVRIHVRTDRGKLHDEWKRQRENPVRRDTSPAPSAWNTVLDDLIRGQILVTVHDHGTGLFETLDEDADGKLSVRELRNAGRNLEEMGAMVNGCLSTARLPRVARAVLSLGHPESSLVTPQRGVTEWFSGMDRNDDGDVSRKEFAGHPDMFDKYDLDKDGLLSFDEADRPEMSIRKK